MTKHLLTGLLLLVVASLPAQATCGGSESFQILHFTKTSGFDHRTRDESAAMFEQIGRGENYTVVDTEDQSAFDDLAVLSAYEVIVFANTSGNIPFTETQRANLEAYVDDGGAVLGIHAATDMYRDGSFPYYSNLIGGSRRNNPAHTSSNYNGTMDAVGEHPSTTGLPDPWGKTEEYYYWPDTGLVAGITEVLRVRPTGTDSYDGVRPISWYQEFDSGARSFYSALGHAPGNYTDPDNDFRLHLRQALCWCVDAEASALPVTVLNVQIEQLANGTDRISYRVGPEELPSRVELFGGPSPALARRLTHADRPGGQTGALSHRPGVAEPTYHYRLHFTDAAGAVTRSPWLVASARDDDRVTVRYADGVPGLYVPSGGPSEAWLVDAAGRTVGTLQLVAGYNELPAVGPGVYFVRFPFRAESLRFVR